MNKSLFIFTIFLILSGCGNSVVEKPNNLIDKDIMIDIFYDLSIIEASKNVSYGQVNQTFEANNYIFKKYKIDSLQFAKSNKYYAADAKKYKKMFEAVNDRLTEKDAEITKINLEKSLKKNTPELR